MKKYFYKLRWILLASIVFSIFNAVLNASMLLFPGWLIDNYQRGLSYIAQMFLAYAGLFLAYLVNAYFFNRAADYRRIRFEKAMKKDFFDAVMKQDFKGFHSREIGEYISMQTNDISEMCMDYINPIFFIVDSSIMILVFGIALVWFVNVYAAAAIIAFSVLTVFVPRITGARLAERNAQYMDGVGKYTASVTTLYESHEILDKAGRGRLIDLHEKKLNHVYDLYMRYRRLNSFALVLNGGSVEAAALLTFVVVAFLLCNGTITLGMAAVAFTYSTKFMDPMYDLNTNIGCVLSALKIKKKILEIIDGCVPDTESGEEIHAISATDLEKNYNDVKIHIPPVKICFPKKYLIRGENGAGKSVFFRLLMNFEKPDSGEICYNGSVKAAGVAESLCYVPQKPVLFDASYEDNVTVYGTYSAAKLPEYESYFPQSVIEHIKQNTDGKYLSGGEQQTVAILRALCSEKPMLLLDEPFAAMNRITVDCFLGHLQEINRTILVIAHNIDDYANRFEEQIVIKR